MAVRDRPRVVIVGAGFAGLWAAQALAGAPVEVVVVDRNNYHSFMPLLYQVAAAELEPEDIIYPIRSILHRQANASFLMGEVSGIDSQRRLVKVNGNEIGYDYLVLALGSKAHYFNVEGAAQNAFPLKTLDDAVRLRNHILCRFEAAMYESNLKLRQQMLTFTIVGGGPTGVEFAGALAELVRAPLKRDYPNIDTGQVHILLLEATQRLLTGLPETLHEYALHRLGHMGVDVRLGSKVSRITSQDVTLQDSRVIPTETVVWTAGVQGEALPNSWDLTTRSNGQVELLPTLQAVNHPEIYVVGDLARVQQDGSPLLLIAPVATQEGAWAAKNILRQLNNGEPQPFHYHDPGMMAVTGRNAAVAVLGGHPFTGFTAWLIWLGVHLIRLIGFRNRLLVLINWAWDYLFFERAVRLILPNPEAELASHGC